MRFYFCHVFNVFESFFKFLNIFTCMIHKGFNIWDACIRRTAAGPQAVPCWRCVLEGSAPPIWEFSPYPYHSEGETPPRLILFSAEALLWGSVSPGGSGVGKGSEEGHAPRAALCRGRHLEGRKYGILKFGRFRRIGVCIADSNILHPNTSLTLLSIGTTPPTVSAPRPHTKQCVCTPRSLHC